VEGQPRTINETLFTVRHGKGDFRREEGPGLTVRELGRDQERNVMGAGGNYKKKKTPEAESKYTISGIGAVSTNEGSQKEGHNPSEVLPS